jgi:hypothetical protein
MRRNLTISFDADFIEHIDTDRGELSRGKFIEALMPGHGELLLRPGEKTSGGFAMLEPMSRAQAAVAHRPTCSCAVCKPPKEKKA